MPGRGKAKSAKSGTKRHYKVKQQKKRFIRSKDPILSVFMWGIQHSVSLLNTVNIFSSLLYNVVFAVSSMCNRCAVCMCAVCVFPT